MATLTIHDVDDSGLAFDLRDLLHVLGPRSLAATWIIKSPIAWTFEATGAGGLHLEKLAEAASHVAGDELFTIANATAQVSWGNFVGFLSDNPDREWLTIRAVDSSFYEVETSDEASIAQIKCHFSDVRITETAG